MKIHGKIEQSAVNGPGERAVIWFQGCTLGCADCWNPETHRTDAGEEWSPRNLADWILSLEGITGVTFSGGEPVQQIEDLAALLDILKRESNLSLGMYTGYTQHELDTGRFISCPGDMEYSNRVRKSRAWASVRMKLDWVKFGRYNRSKPVNKPLVTSKNQELVMTSGRHTLEAFPPQAVEDHIDDKGFVFITGFPVDRKVA